MEKSNVIELGGIWLLVVKALFEKLNSNGSFKKS